MPLLRRLRLRVTPALLTVGVVAAVATLFVVGTPSST
jgi:hypothetical protein